MGEENSKQIEWGACNVCFDSESDLLLRLSLGPVFPKYSMSAQKDFTELRVLCMPIR